MLVVLFVGGGMERAWVGPSLIAGLFVFSLAGAWVNSPHVEDPGGEIVPYLPWFGTGRSKE